MSAKATFWAWHIDDHLPAGHPDKLSPIQKMVLVRLGDHANEDGIAWPGKDTLANACNIKSKRTVDQAIKILVGLRHIAIRQRATVKGKSQSNVYVLNLKQGDLFKDKGVQSSQGCKSDTPANDSNLGVQEMQGEGAGNAPESTNESTNESTTSSSPPAAPSNEAPKKYKTKKGKELIGARVERFFAFWEVFGYKFGKAEAGDAWYQLETADIPRQNQALILFAAKQTAVARPGLEANGSTPKMAEGWLSGRRFEDFAEAFEAHQKKMQAQPDPDEKTEWWETWDGITGMGSSYGIYHGHFGEDPAGALNELITAIEKAGNKAPPDLVTRYNHLASQRKSA